ncbi:MOSC domain-containing protein [Kitasatospora aureofaciens]|uniref:MOSC domain-containing protein n=1 Tax=Kitasatospora aureofaciens TaxID=1894 RepID=UPI001C445191|nr:MOSC N-terminal beta barrel domain-containing protein [Kitasatospora aureofaciens]MBV6698967.1 MOSC N-terminal beta barrel domain-containing protein [Kitasatospora aureofaciens]
MAAVVELRYYPIKGCAGISAERAELAPAGLAHDRAFMVVDEQGVFRSQRRDRLLATVRPSVGEDGRRLTLEAPGAGPVTVPVDTEGPRRKVELFGAPFFGIDQGEAVADWLSEVLGVRSRLVRVPPEHDRVTDGLIPGTSGYADSCAVHLLSRATLDDFNARTGELPLPVDRFRPNIVVDGWDEPHTEDLARHIAVGDAESGAELGYAKLAVRCAVTLVDQTTGAKAGPEPLRTLARYRRAAAGGVAFGSKFAVLRPGTLRVGDGLTVSTWGPSEL